jgi:hypothetical protein
MRSGNTQLSQDAGTTEVWAMKRSTRGIVWVAVILLGVLASGELFSRFCLGLGDPPLVRADPEMAYVFVGPRTYHRFGNTIVYNRFGMRSRDFDARRKNPDEIRILFCGNSVINGGALTDQADVATTRIERRLETEFHRPAVVMNVSAGGWGPPNYLAYVQRYGLFEANVLVIVVISGDAANTPSFAPMAGVNPDFPDRTPTFALSEAIWRYLPRYLSAWTGGVPQRADGAPSGDEPSQGQIDHSMAAFESLVKLAQERNIPVIVAQHPENRELGVAETEGHRLLRNACEALSVVRVDMSEGFEKAIKEGKNPYRDNIHPNTYGQQVISEILYPVIARSLQDRGITPGK